MSIYCFYHDVKIPGPLPVWPEQPDSLDELTARCEYDVQWDWYRSDRPDRWDRLLRPVRSRRHVLRDRRVPYTRRQCRPAAVAAMVEAGFSDYAWELIEKFGPGMDCITPFKEQWLGRNHLLTSQMTTALGRVLLTDMLREIRIARYFRRRRNALMNYLGQTHGQYSTFMTMNTFRHHARDWNIRPLRYGRNHLPIKGTQWPDLIKDHGELLYVALRHSSLGTGLEESAVAGDRSLLKLDCARLAELARRSLGLELSPEQTRTALAHYRWVRSRELRHFHHSLANHRRRRRSRQIRVLRYDRSGFKYTVLSKKPRATFKW